MQRLVKEGLTCELYIKNGLAYAAKFETPESWFHHDLIAAVVTTYGIESALAGIDELMTAGK